MELAPGSMVTPHVQLLRPLGEGGMGSLWVARHGGWGIEVAVKFVWMDLVAKDPSILERFDREACTLVKLDSPHVVKLFERGTTDDGTPFIVMELLHGETLVDRLERAGEMTHAQAAQVMAQLAAGLAHVHSRAIVHRDLKAENVFLVGPEHNPLVKILDFGLAKEPGAPGDKKLTGLGMLVGTAEFMSPEQILSAKDVDHRADLWAYAVLGYMLLTAARPFEGEKLGAVFTAIRTSSYAAPSALRPGLSPWVDAWFARAFHIDYRQRFSSAEEASQALLGALTPQLAQAAPSAPAGRVPLAAIAAAAALVGAAIAAILLVLC